MPMSSGIADAARRTPDMPPYTQRNKTTGDTIQPTDPGRALVTGRWRDIGKFKGPILRGLAARPPYFHNGMAATVEDVIRFYDQRFALGLTAREKSDLLAFLVAVWPLTRRPGCRAARRGRRWRGGQCRRAATP